jgi:hypothetical protein
MIDIVYFLKDTEVNEELRYSLRSVEQNFEHGKIWFYGGCPKGLKPDKWVHVNQTQPGKWERVKQMLYLACQNEDLSDDFYLFNDDFFIMKPWTYEPVYNKTLDGLIKKSEKLTGGVNKYSYRLRETVRVLEASCCGIKNYAVHMPIKFNKQKVLEVLRAFPGCSMFRSLYGNYNEIGGVCISDCKITKLDEKPDVNVTLLSTNDQSFQYGLVGEYIRSQFKQPCRYEVE